MKDKWHPKPPPRTRAGALGFIFVLILFLVIAVLLFQLNPASPSPNQTVDSPPRGATPEAGEPDLHWRLFLPLIRS